MGKKDRQTIVNNIDSVNVDIDYDKLADAIAKAQESAKYKKSPSAGAFAFLASVIFHISSWLGFAISILTIVSTLFYYISVASWIGVSAIAKNIMAMVLTIGFSALLFCFALLLKKSAKEMEVETDRSYIVAVFSGLVSFSALIVALVALLKGVA